MGVFRKAEMLYGGVLTGPSWWALMLIGIPFFMNKNSKRPSEASDIPRNIDECIQKLFEILSKEKLDDIKSLSKDELAWEHIGLGLWIRNHWIHKYPDGPLVQSFTERGIEDPDEMSSEVLSLLWQNLQIFQDDRI